MDKELLKDTEILTNSGNDYITFDRNVITQNLCPQIMWDKRDTAKYGKVEHITYYSETTGCERGANILFPPNYDENKKYPVMYFQHGIFGDEFSMINDPNNRLDILVGNMIDDGLIDELIIVFSNMYATGDPELKPGFDSKQVEPYDNFINDLANDLIPYIERTYNVLTDRENRAVIGFSMGGRESLYIGLQRSDLFAFTGSISAAPGILPTQDSFMSHAGQLKSKEEMIVKCKDHEPELILICCGTKDGVVGQYPKSYHEVLVENGVKHLWYEVPGADHDSNAIRSGMYNFLLRWIHQE